MQDKQPLTQGLEQKLREAGFAPPESMQKQGSVRHNNHGRNNPSKETKMENNQQQQQVQPPQPQPQIPQIPDIPDNLGEHFGGLMDALKKKLEAEKQPSQFETGEVLTFAAKAGVAVVAVAAGTAVVVGIARLIGGDSTPELPTPAP